MSTKIPPPLLDTVRFNLNHRVRYRLTAYGREIQRQHYARFGLTPRPAQERLGWHEDQLHALMRVFGEAMEPGSQCPIWTELHLLPDPYDVYLSTQGRGAVGSSRNGEVEE